MKSCQNCGHQMKDDMMFCQRCGTKYEVEISESSIIEIEQDEAVIENNYEPENNIEDKLEKDDNEYIDVSNKEITLMNENKITVLRKKNMVPSFAEIEKKHIILGAISLFLLIVILSFSISNAKIDCSDEEGYYKVYSITDPNGETYYEDEYNEYLYLDIETDGAITFDYYDWDSEDSATVYGDIKKEVNISKIEREGIDTFYWEDADNLYMLKFNDGTMGYMAYFSDDEEITLYYKGYEYRIYDRYDSIFDDNDYDYSYDSYDNSYDSYDNDDGASYDPNDPYYSEHDYDGDGKLTTDEWQDAMNDAIDDLSNGTYKSY